MIATNVIIMWPGAHANIPANYVRETSLDSKFIKGTAAATNPNVTGGSPTHSHAASANHGHTMASHSHLVGLSNVGSPSSNSTDSSGTEGIPGNHSHNFNLAGVSGGSLSSVAATYGSISNNPPYREMIFIRATKHTKVPDGAVVFYADATPPSGFDVCDGNNGTQDCRNKFIRGAATGADAGGTGGSSQNVHPLNHTHAESPHSHSGSTGGQITDSGGKRGQSGNNRLSRGHTHNVSLNSNSAGNISAVNLTTSETVEPEYKKLLAIQNNNGDAAMPRNIIGLWLGNLSLIPPGWVLCDGNNDTEDMRGKYIKVANTGGEIGNTGGSNTHVHASQGHVHSGGSHSHTGNNTDDHWSKNTVGPVGGNQDLQDGGSAHSVQSVGSAAASWNSSNTSANSANNEPEYRTVAYIQYKFEPIPGLLLAFL